MKKIFISFFVVLSFMATPALAATNKPVVAKATAAWKAIIPDGYTPITWAKAPGIVSFFKAPSGSGSLDFLTRINLVQNQIQFIATSSAPLDWGAANPNFIRGTVQPLVVPAVSDPTDPFSGDPIISSTTASITTTIVTATGTFRNFAFARIVAEAGKAVAPTARFIWNGPFFNITVDTSDLSLALKTTFGTSTLVTSGSRPVSDMAAARKMLTINNQTGKAAITDFDQAVFVSPTSSDQALEGFAPTAARSDSANGSTARLFLGVSKNGQELVIYCSRGATVQEASGELLLAGVNFENQLQADGGGSATCGYNLPGHYFVEPARTVPLLMGAVTILSRGVATTKDSNVRSGPGTKYPIVTKLPKSAPVPVFEEKNGWYRIGAGQWIIKSLIKKSK